jgi:hypothetical protein
MTEAQKVRPDEPRFFGAAQDVLNAIWKAVRRLDGQPTQPSQVKLNGRRGYGDGEIPSPERKPDEQ